MPYHCDKCDKLIMAEKWLEHEKNCEGVKL